MGYIHIFWFNALLGWIGLDRFLTGNILFGVLKCVTMCGLGVWCIVDQAFYRTGSFKAKNGLTMWMNKVFIPKSTEDVAPVEDETKDDPEEPAEKDDEEKS